MKRVMLTSSMLITVTVVLVPFYWLIVAATHSNADVFGSPPPLLPGGELMDNLAALEQRVGFSRTILNSVLISGLYTLGAGAVCTLAGYGFAVYDFRGKELLFGLIMLGLVVPSQVTLVPLFKMMLAMDWLNTYQAIILPNLALPFGIFLMRQSMSTLPRELLAAGRADGCGELRLFLRVALPVMRPALAALAIYLFLYQWNDFVWPLIALRTADAYTIPLALAAQTGATDTDYGAILAGTAVAAIPMAVLFLFLQRHFVSGLLAGAVKE
ncbi:carbohydrate ABC transporter permease [Nonomuraea spiralis]|uniref:carbohydrate ABC transporter permease n=1 Tax=Nonomuraea TaxID=83681 RepID=UPI0021ADACA7|nr:carbohydrate ABC transporter permease [Nonomuraea sp. WAC 01424]